MSKSLENFGIVWQKFQNSGLGFLFSHLDILFILMTPVALHVPQHLLIRTKCLLLLLLDALMTYQGIDVI